MSTQHLIRTDLFTKAILSTIALSLGLIAIRLYERPPAVQAQSEQPSFYIEPRTTLLRKPDGTQQVQGKVVIDMRNGDIWGFPTFSNTPYPVDSARGIPAVSAPIYLGRFDFSKMTPAEREKSMKQ